MDRNSYNVLRKIYNSMHETQWKHRKKILTLLSREAKEGSPEKNDWAEFYRRCRCLSMREGKGKADQEGVIDMQGSCIENPSCVAHILDF